ncbi:MAG: Rieske 2Fe-2S domain-containing protein [Firmicutes bacterium]|nr:Rieske 2Fe-2S domain-containing protein [Bacillota bacterium]
MSQIPEGGKLKATVEDVTLLVTNIDGEYFAINNRCPHMGGSLYDGILEDETVTCPRHRTVFHVKTGAVVQGGNIAFIRLKVADAKAYPVRIEGDDILVGLE